MYLSSIELYHFKNHPKRSMQFSKKINCIIGKNGVGKTNLLDAIYYLCLTKSYFNSVDQQNIFFGAGAQAGFRLKGDFRKGAEAFEVVYKLQANKRKELTVSDQQILRLSEHIGKFPAIIIAPDDAQLITGSSEERRRFLDSTISQVNHQYLDQLILYNKVLAQRNAALKKFAESKKVDRALIESYNRQLVPLGIAIYEARKIAVERLYPIFQSFYKDLSFEREIVNFVYSSQLEDRTFDELLEANFDRDLFLQRTDVGIHKDDIMFMMQSVTGDVAIKKFASQGQQKSFVISIKFAQFDFIKNGLAIAVGDDKTLHPLLLIDDIFDKLDNERSQKLVELLSTDHFGQVFLTDTDDAHIREALKGKDELFEVFYIN